MNLLTPVDAMVNVLEDEIDMLKRYRSEHAQEFVVVMYSPKSSTDPEDWKLFTQPDLDALPRFSTRGEASVYQNALNHWEATKHMPEDCGWGVFLVHEVATWAVGELERLRRTILSNKESWVTDDVTSRGRTP